MRAVRHRRRRRHPSQLGPLVRLVPDTSLIYSQDPAGAMFGEPIWCPFDGSAREKVIAPSLVVHILVKRRRPQARLDGHLVAIPIAAGLCV